MDQGVGTNGKDQLSRKAIDKLNWQDGTLWGAGLQVNGLRGATVVRKLTV